MNQSLTSLNSVKWLICRICLRNKGADELKLIFDNNTSILNDIREFGAIQCIQNKNFPDKICQKCLLLLKAAKTFRTLSREAEESFQSLDLDLLGEERIDFEETDNPAMAKEELEAFIYKDYKNKNDHDPTAVTESTPAPCVEQDEKNEEPEETSCDKVLEDDNDTSFETTIVRAVHNYAEPQSDEVLDIEVLHDDMDFHSTESSQDVNFITKDESTNESENRSEEEIVETIKFEADLSSAELKCKRNKKKNSNKTQMNRLIDSTFICPVCSNYYTEKSKLTLHMKLHNKIKPHICELCGKSFSQTPQLARHMNSHTGSRPYKCKFCDSSFADPSTCIKHQRIHTNERPYKCEICGKAFAYSNVLKVHTLTHTGEKPYACQFCEKRFTQLHHMKSHEKTHQQNLSFFKIVEQDGIGEIVTDS